MFVGLALARRQEYDFENQRSVIMACAEACDNTTFLDDSDLSHERRADVGRARLIDVAVREGRAVGVVVPIEERCR